MGRWLAVGELTAFIPTDSRPRLQARTEGKLMQRVGGRGTACHEPLLEPCPGPHRVHVLNARITKCHSTTTPVSLSVADA
jgi:hypothetical protein